MASLQDETVPSLELSLNGKIQENEDEIHLIEKEKLSSDNNLRDTICDQENHCNTNNINNEPMSLNRPFFTLPRLLSGRRKKIKRKQTITCGESNVSHIDDTKSIGQTSSISYQPNGYVKENFFIRLMRHLASPVHGNYYSEQNKLKKSRTKQGSFVSSASNGDIKSHYNVSTNNELATFTNSHCKNGFGNEFNLPAVCGIKNHGNTCFMNAIIQCLCNTDLLAEYFVMNHYKVDLLRHNKIHAKKYGTKGQVTEQLGLFLKSLWSCQYTQEISNRFKILVSKYGSQYEGNNQHDSQEFLLWLLDKCHEDLNIANKKKYKKIKALPYNLSDEIIAAETLSNHMRCNSSFIHDLFQAQLKSTLVCRSCGKQSNTFDPYLCLSLPVPTRFTYTIIVTAVYLDRTPREVQIGVSTESLATLRELRDKISRLLKVPEKQLVLLLVEPDNGLKELVKDQEIVSEIIDDMENIIAIETPKITNPVVNLENNSNSNDNGIQSEMLTLVWANKLGIGNHGKIFGPLFSTLVSREASFKQIQRVILLAIKSIVKKDVDIDLISNQNIIRLYVIGGIPGKCYLPEDVDHPLYMPTVDTALSISEDKDYRGPIHLKLIIEWDLEMKQQFLIEDDQIEKPTVDNSIEYIKLRSQKTNRATLQDCFQMYFKEEKLAADNAWMCPSCKRRQQCFKKLSLWSVPDVFIVHLKRFRHVIQSSNSQRAKLSTLVLFPIHGLDMTEYLSPRNYHVQQTNGNALPTFWSPWKRPRIYGNFSKNDDNLYDLYAVCNHHGNMQGGHYTAYCKNPIDGCWYSFDDTKVSQIQESSIITEDAYILFYQRSSLSSSALSSCASSSTSGYSSASSFSVEHWAFRMPSFNGFMPKTSKSQEGLSQIKETKSETLSNLRGQRAYASLPSKSRQMKQTKFKSQKMDNALSNSSEDSSSTVVPIGAEEKEDLVQEEKSQNQNNSEVVYNSFKQNTEKIWAITSV